MAYNDGSGAGGLPFRSPNAPTAIEGASEAQGRFRVQRVMLRSKIHRATLTGTQLDYEGSIAVDRDLMDAADMLPWEEIHIWDVTNGSRLVSYILPGPRGTGTICINGAAAHLVKPGDMVIMATYAQMDEEEARGYQPTVVVVDEHNRIKDSSYQEKPLHAVPLS